MRVDHTQSGLYTKNRDALARGHRHENTHPAAEPASKFQLDGTATSILVFGFFQLESSKYRVMKKRRKRDNR